MEESDEDFMHESHGDPKAHGFFHLCGVTSIEADIAMAIAPEEKAGSATVVLILGNRDEESPLAVIDLGPDRLWVVNRLRAMADKLENLE